MGRFIPALVMLLVWCIFLKSFAARYGPAYFGTEQAKHHATLHNPFSTHFIFQEQLCHGPELKLKLV
jgi:hypothetical protein